MLRNKVKNIMISVKGEIILATDYVGHNVAGKCSIFGFYIHHSSILCSGDIELPLDAVTLLSIQLLNSNDSIPSLKKHITSMLPLISEGLKKGSFLRI
jgi:hypothetical protein